MEGNTEAAEAAADARWARAENTLYASLVSEPHTYERVVGLVGILLDHLRADVHDRAALVAASERGTDLIGELSAESVVPWVPAEQALSAACAVRSRELSATADRQKRASTLAEASRAGLAWARIEPSVAGMGPMVAPVTWVHRPTGTAVVATTGMDPDTGALLFTVGAARVDPDTGDILAALPLAPDRTTTTVLDRDAYVVELQRLIERLDSENRLV